MPISRSSILRIAIFVLTFAAFVRLIPCDFTWWDDQQTISENPLLNPPTWNSVGYFWTHPHMELYVPVTYTVWSGLAALAHRDHPDKDGLMLDAWVFHTANVLIHAASAEVVFQLLLRLIGSDVAAAIGALLFALHPVQVESVGWISGTKDLLCGLFSTCALLMYVRSIQLKSDDPHKRGPGRWRYLLGISFFTLAMLSKPTAVVVPLMAGVIAIFLLECPIRKTIISLVPWFVLMLPCLYLTQKVQPAEWASPLRIWARPAVAADAIAFYVCKLVLPIHFCVDYGHNPSVIVANHLIYFSWIFPVLVGSLVWHRYERHRPAVAAALLFILPLMPVLGFVPFEFESVSTTADHYLYLPMVGVGLLVGWAVNRFQIEGFEKLQRDTGFQPVLAARNSASGDFGEFSMPVHGPEARVTMRRHHISIWIAGVILVALGTRSVLQEASWQNTRSLFYNTLAVNPQSVAATDGLGFITGRDARAFSKAGNPFEARVLFDDSINWYRRSLANNPKSVPSMMNLALDYQAIGRTGLGLEQIHRIVREQPELPPGLKADPIVLAHHLIDFGDIPGAIAWLDEVIRRDPANTDAILLHEQAIEHLPTTTQPS